MTGEYVDKWIAKHVIGQTCRQLDRQTGRQHAAKQEDTQIDVQTGRMVEN